MPKVFGIPKIPHNKTVKFLTFVPNHYPSSHFENDFVSLKTYLHFISFARLACMAHALLSHTSNMYVCMYICPPLSNAATAAAAAKSCRCGCRIVFVFVERTIMWI